jgi:hypothetical protein
MRYLDRKEYIQNTCVLQIQVQISCLSNSTVGMTEIIHNFDTLSYKGTLNECII